MRQSEIIVMYVGNGARANIEAVPWPSWLGRGTNNAKIGGSIPSGTILFRAFRLSFFCF